MSTIDRYTGPPTEAEYTGLNRMAEGLSRTQMVPDAFRGKPHEIVAAALYGREIGLSPLASLHHINVIKGKPTLSAQGMVAVVRAAGHSISGESSATEAIITGTRKDTGDKITVKWDLPMAKAAGLTTDNWRKYPQAMLWARAVTQLCRMLFPDVLAGFSYTPEELGDEPAADDLPDHAVTVEAVKPLTPAQVADGIERIAQRGTFDAPTEATATAEELAARELVERGEDDESLDQMRTVDYEAAADAVTVEAVERTEGLDWDDVAREIAEAAGVQVDDRDVIAEIRKRRNLMRPLHTRLGEVLDDAAKDRLLTGTFRVGSWKQVPSERIKKLLDPAVTTDDVIRSAAGVTS